MGPFSPLRLRRVTGLQSERSRTGLETDRISAAQLLWEGVQNFRLLFSCSANVMQATPLRLGAQRVKKRGTGLLQLLFQPRRAVAVTASPRLGSILIAAVAAIVSILHARQIEILFPVRTLFLQGRRTIADFHPPRSLVFAQPSILHIAEIFSFGYRTLAEGFLLNGFQQITLTAGFYPGSNQISHLVFDLILYCSPAAASMPRNWLRVRMSIDSVTSLPSRLYTKLFGIPSTLNRSFTFRLGSSRMG